MADMEEFSILEIIKTFKLDLTQFHNLNFDNISEEKSIKPFLLWLYNSFDEFNVVQDQDLLCSPDYALSSSEQLFDSSYHCDSLSDIYKSHQLRHYNNSKKLAKLRLLDDELRNIENDAVKRLNKARKVLTSNIATGGADRVEKQIEDVYKLCLSAHPTVPDLTSYNTEADKLYESCGMFYQERVVAVQTRLSEDEKVENARSIESLEVKLLESENRLQLSIENLMSTCISTNLEVIFESTKENHQNLVTRRLRDRQINNLSKQIERTAYLHGALHMNRELLINSLSVTIIGRGVLLCHFLRTQALFDSIFTFIHLITSEGEYVEGVMKRCHDNFQVISTDEVDGSRPSRVSCENRFLAVYKNLLAHLEKEYMFSSQSWQEFGTMVRHFRSGPTKEFRFLPIPLLISMRDCKEFHKKVALQIRQIAGKYSQMKKEMQHLDRGQQLLWVSFLVEPHKLINNHAEQSTLFSSTSIKHNRSQWS